MDRILHAGFADKPYSQFLEDKFKISGQLREAIIYAIAIADAQGKYGIMNQVRTSMHLFMNKKPIQGLLWKGHRHSYDQWEDSQRVVTCVRFMVVLAK